MHRISACLLALVVVSVLSPHTACATDERDTILAISQDTNEGRHVDLSYYPQVMTQAECHRAMLSELFQLKELSDQMDVSSPYAQNRQSSVVERVGLNRAAWRDSSAVVKNNSRANDIAIAECRPAYDRG